MGGPLRTGICVVIWVLLVARAGAQAGDELQAPYSTAGVFPTLSGPRRFINGPTNPSPETPFETIQEEELEDLKDIGGTIEESGGDTRLNIRGHSYVVDDEVEPTPLIPNRSNGHSGGAVVAHAGEATQEGPHRLADALVLSNSQQVSEASVGQTVDENPTDGSSSGGPGENKSPPVPDADLRSSPVPDADPQSSPVSDADPQSSPVPDADPQSSPVPDADPQSSPVPDADPQSPPVPDAYLTDWSPDSDKWTYREEEWVVVNLPSPDYPSLPTPPPPTAALVVVANETVELERNVSGLANVTLHYRFYLSDNHDSDTTPELKVFQVVEDTRTLLQEDKEQGQWNNRTIEVPPSDISTILFEGLFKGDGDVIALSDVVLTGVTLAKDEALDVGDEMTLNPDQPIATEYSTSTPATEETQTQDLPAPKVSDLTVTENQDNNTGLVQLASTQADLPLDSTAETPQDPAEEVEGDWTKTPTNLSEPGVSTDESQNATRGSEPISDDKLAPTTPTDAKESETDEETSTTTVVPDDDGSTPKNGPDDVLSTDYNTNNSSNTDNPGNRNTPSQAPTKTEPTDKEQDLSTDILDAELTSGTTLQPNETSRNGTSSSEAKASPEQTVPETTPLPLPAVNSTEAVMAAPVSSTSWQVFQVFLVLCAMGLLALGFLYWKRRRRQDDEIPVFTRHTDYHNPTFSMEDAANFMSRAGRNNTYKTIE